MTRVNWSPEPHTKVNFLFEGNTISVEGCFHHTLCERFATTGRPFPNFSCSVCSQIPLERDFRQCVLQESLSLEKRGARSTRSGRRLDYLSNAELATYSRIVGKKLNHEKLKVLY
jgi:hypothetical protein